MSESIYDAVARDAGLQALLSDAVQAVNASEGSLLLLTPDGKKMRFVVCKSPVADKLLGTEQALDNGITGLSVSLQQPMIVNDTAADPSFSKDVDTLTKVTTKSILVVPLAAPEKEFGALTAINSKASTGFSSQDLAAYCDAAEKVCDRLESMEFDPLKPTND